MEMGLFWLFFCGAVVPALGFGPEAMKNLKEIGHALSMDLFREEEADTPELPPELKSLPVSPKSCYRRAFK